MEEIKVRVIDLETAGNGPNDVCEIGWQDVVLGQYGRWSINDERGALFVNPGRPISAETMAVHHILDSQVTGAPLWKQIAATILQPAEGVQALAAHRAAFEQRCCTSRLSGALPGSAHGNVPCAFGRSCHGFPTRCCAISGCRKVWFTRSGYRLTGQCPMPMSLPIICATC